MDQFPKSAYTWFEGEFGEIRLVLSKCGTKFYVFKLEPAPKATEYKWVKIDTVSLTTPSTRTTPEHRYTLSEVQDR